MLITIAFGNIPSNTRILPNDIVISTVPSHIYFIIL